MAIFDTIVKKSNGLILSICIVGVFASGLYIFNPDAPWNTLIAAQTIPAPETQPALNREAIQQFFNGLNEHDRKIYFYYEGFVDALFFLSVTGFSICLLGLTLKKNEWLGQSSRWILTLPLILLVFELVEGATLLSIMELAPDRVEALLWVSDLATTGKLASYLGLLIVNFLAMLLLFKGFFHRVR